MCIRDMFSLQMEIKCKLSTMDTQHKDAAKLSDLLPINKVFFGDKGLAGNRASCKRYEVAAQILFITIPYA